MSLFCSAPWLNGSDYNFVPTPTTAPESNPGGGNIFRTCPDRPWVALSLMYNTYQVFPRVKKRPGRDSKSSPLLVTWSRKSWALPVLRLRAVQPEQSLSDCTRVHFNLLFTLPQRGTGTAVAQWLKRCATNRQVAGSIPAGVIGIFHWYTIFPIALWHWGRLSL